MYDITLFYHNYNPLWYSESIWKSYDPHVFLGSTPWPSRRSSAVVCTGLTLVHRRGPRRSQMRVVEDTCDLDISPTSGMFEDDFSSSKVGYVGSPGGYHDLFFFLGVIYISVLFLLVFGDRSCCWDVETFGTRFLEFVSFSFQPFQGDQLQADLSAMAGGYEFCVHQLGLLCLEYCDKAMSWAPKVAKSCLIMHLHYSFRGEWWVVQFLWCVFWKSSFWQEWQLKALAGSSMFNRFHFLGAC